MGVSFLVDAINKSIEEYKKGLSNVFPAGGNAYTDSNADKIKCIVIARGQIGQFDGGRKLENDDKLSKTYGQLGFRDYPSFYLELKVDFKDGRALLTPQYLSYAASSARSKGSGMKHVSLVLAFSDISQKKPNEIAEDKAFAIFRHDFGRLKIGKRYDSRLLKGTAASAFLTPEDLWKKGFNISAVVTESEDPGLALQVLSEGFVNKKGDLQKAMEDTIKKAIGVNTDDKK